MKAWTHNESNYPLIWFVSVRTYTYITYSSAHARRMSERMRSESFSMRHIQPGRDVSEIAQKICLVFNNACFSSSFWYCRKIWFSSYTILPGFDSRLSLHFFDVPRFFAWQHARQTPHSQTSAKSKWRSVRKFYSVKLIWYNFGDLKAFLVKLLHRFTTLMIELGHAGV